MGLNQIRDVYHQFLHGIDEIFAETGCREA